MILESAQLLCTAHRVLDGVQETKLSSNGRKLKTWRLLDPEKDAVFYKTTHYNHPCALWVRESQANYFWLESLLNSLYNEYTKRYQGKIHLTQKKLGDCLIYPPANLLDLPFTDPPQAMDQYPHCKVEGDTVQAYRNYYMDIKAELAEWKSTPVPYWYKN